jgi:LysR family nod box-dependent transcriptional activator
MLNRGELDIIVAPERFMAADHPAEALFDEEFRYGG